MLFSPTGNKKPDKLEAQEDSFHYRFNIALLGNIDKTDFITAHLYEDGRNLSTQFFL